MFNLAIDSKLRGYDVVRLRVEDVAPHAHAVDQATARQKNVIAIVWTNHHYLVRYATEANLRLLWFNFAHLFSMSLLPLSTAWMANSELAPQPVAFLTGGSDVGYILSAGRADVKQLRELKL
jgi:hypothetical protein